MPFDLRKILDLPKPKRYLSAFNFFLKEKNASTVFEKIEGRSHAENLGARLKVFSDEWKKLSPEKQAKYEEMKMRDK